MSIFLAMAIPMLAHAAGIKTGGARMIEVDGKYHVWTDRVGKGPVKMLTLHGGPGFPHDYLECFEDFLPQHWADLPKIKVSTLLIAGAKGTMNPEDIRRMGELIPRSRVVITSGSHLEMYDDQEAYFKALVQFIKDVEAGEL